MYIGNEGEQMIKKIITICTIFIASFWLIENVHAEGATCAYAIEGYTSYFICIVDENSVFCKKDESSHQLGIEEKSLKLEVKNFQNNAIWKCPSTLYGDFSKSAWTIKNLSVNSTNKKNNAFQLMKDKSSDGGKVTHPIVEDTDNSSLDKTQTSGTVGCAILGGANSETVKILASVVKMIRLGVPILIIILGIIDFMRILFSGEEKVFKESFSRFTKRIMIGVIIIFVPYFLQLVLNLSGIQTQYGIDNFFCGIIDATNVSSSNNKKEDPASFYTNAKGCESAGYIWNAVKSVCVSGTGNTISTSDCVASGYVTVSDASAPGGFVCKKGSNPSKKPEEYKSFFACNNAGHIWNAVSKKCMGDTKISKVDCEKSGYKMSANICVKKRAGEHTNRSDCEKFGYTWTYNEDESGYCHN